MGSRPAIRWPARVRRGAGALGAMLLFAVVGAPVAHACSGSAIPFERVVAHPGSIGLVRVLDVAGNAQAPDRYRLAVDEVWRGGLPPVLEIEAPVVHVCGDRLFAARGDRLVLALDVNAFDDADRMAAYWAIDAAGRIGFTAVEERPGVTTLKALRAVLAPAGAVLPDDASAAPTTSEDAGVPLVVALLAIASCVLGGAVLVAALARRRHRDERG
jgi:hypothetical protein